MTTTVANILANYEGENLGVRTNLARILNHSTLAGTGKKVFALNTLRWMFQR
jgi:fructose-bisphosphate aldolase, class I